MKKMIYIGLVFLIMFLGMSGVSAKDCNDYKSKNKCTTSADPKCVWNSKFKFCSVDGLVFVACGKGATNLNKLCGYKSGAAAYDIPYMVPQLTSFAVNALKIATPVILIFVGLIQMIKALTASAEDEIKKAQGALVKKILIATMIFGIISITQFIIDLVSDSYNSNEATSVSGCVSCFVNNNCPVTYYRKGTNQEKCVKIKK